MDFGVILDKWEKQAAGNSHADGMAAAYGKDADTPEDENPIEKHPNRIERKKNDAFIDLHGLNSGEAWAALEVFFENSRKTGCKKVLIIHGKGNHRVEAPRNKNARNRVYEGSLRELSRRFIESCSFAGKSGHGPAREGGTGATWVMLKS